MLIVVEGCVGAGKSTVSTGLARHRGSDLLLERFESNPFLEAFYQDPGRYAMETEFAFLLIHTHQLKMLQIPLKGEIISDFHIEKDLLYSRLNLHEQDATTLFQSMFAVCERQVPRPDLTIYLSASNELIRSRIRRRERNFELAVDFEYFERVNEAYSEFYSEVEGKKLRIPMDEWDFIENPGLFEHLSRLVDQEIIQ